MRLVHWLFLLSVLLFVCGIGFVLASARTMKRSAQPGEPGQSFESTPVATVKQLMLGIVAPAATTVFQSVGTVVTQAGVENREPRTAEEWETVGNSAVALVEAGNLMMMGSRAVDRDDWAKMTKALMDSAMVTLKAIEAKDKEGVLLSGEALNASCDACHQKYQRQ